MGLMIVRHKVKDYRSWKKAFDAGMHKANMTMPLSDVRFRG